jgi:hypothetical protein
MKSSFVTVECAALDETNTGDIILRCVVALGSLENLMTDDYQREALPLTSISDIVDALKGGQTLPDIELGMRGGRFKETKDGEFVLQDPVYIIDGLQRRNAALHVLNEKPGMPIRIGATVHFNTDKEWERERFRILNTMQTKVSPNVLLRNRREGSPAVSLMHSLSVNDNAFVLHDRVCWSQRMTRGQLLSALMFLKVVGLLHSHKAPTKRSSVSELVPAMDKAVEMVGPQIMRDNTRHFFDLIDQCWGIRKVQYREGATYLKGAFMKVLAMIISDHREFWRSPDEKRLMVEADLRRKLALFPVHDPQVINLSSSGGKATEILYMLLRDHINSGKRSRRLTPRNGDRVILNEETDGNEE